MNSFALAMPNPISAAFTCSIVSDNCCRCSAIIGDAERELEPELMVPADAKPSADEETPDE